MRRGRGRAKRKYHRGLAAFLHHHHSVVAMHAFDRPDRPTPSIGPATPTAGRRSPQCGSGPVHARGFGAESRVGRRGMEARAKKKGRVSWRPLPVGLVSSASDATPPRLHTAVVHTDTHTPGGVDRPRFDSIHAFTLPNKQTTGATRPSIMSIRAVTTSSETLSVVARYTDDRLVRDLFAEPLLDDHEKMQNAATAICR